MSGNEPADNSGIGQKLEPRIVTIESNETIRPFGIDMKVLLNTGGSFSALYVVHQPGEGPPPHVHYNQEEYFYILEGTYEMTLAM